MAHLPKEEREAFAERVLASRDVLDRFEEIFEQRLSESARGMRSKKFYETQGSYSHRVADNLGYERALQEILDILKVK